MNYEETIEQLEDEIVAIGSILPQGSELTREAMQDAITLLKHYREGLEWIKISMENANKYRQRGDEEGVGLCAAESLLHARKTLEGPK